MNDARGFESTGISSAELDAHITGNFGDDQNDDSCDHEECAWYETCIADPGECDGPFLPCERFDEDGHDR